SLARAWRATCCSSWRSSCDSSSCIITLASGADLETRSGTLQGDQQPSGSCHGHTPVAAEHVQLPTGIEPNLKCIGVEQLHGNSQGVGAAPVGSFFGVDFW